MEESNSYLDSARIKLKTDDADKIKRRSRSFNDGKNHKGKLVLSRT